MLPDKEVGYLDKQFDAFVEKDTRAAWAKS